MVLSDNDLAVRLVESLALALCCEDDDVDISKMLVSSQRSTESTRPWAS